MSLNKKLSYIGAAIAFTAGLVALREMERHDQRSAYNSIKEGIVQLKAEREQGFYQTAETIERDLSEGIAELKEERPYFITSNEVVKVDKDFNSVRYLLPTNEVIRNLDKLFTR